MTSALIASWAAILLLALVVSGLIRQVHQLSRDAPRPGLGVGQRLGIRPGTPAPGAAELLGEDAVGRGAVLLFLSADCRTCSDVLAEAARWLKQRGDGPAVRGLYAGPAPRTTAGGIPVSGDRAELFALYDAVATPFAVAVDGDGRVLRSEPLGSAAALPDLLDDAFPHQARTRPRSAR